MLGSRALRLSALVLLGATAACTADAGSSDGDESDLTSVTARSRTLSFVGTVYVAENASAPTILQAVRAQAQTAFGPLRTQDMAVNSRELKDVDASTFVKRNVQVVGKSGTKPMLEVKYTYNDNAVVAASYAKRSSAPLALMNPGYKTQLDRVLRECTANDDEAKEFKDSIWYVFEPKLAQCGDAIKKEQGAIDADRASLADPKNQVAESEATRLYLPITAQLGADKTNRGESYPDYDRLYKGGVASDKLVISFVYGLIDHEANVSPEKDSNWAELMTMLDEAMDGQGGGFDVVKGPDRVDLSSFTTGSGKTVANPSFSDLVKLNTGGSKLGLSKTDATSLEKQFAARITEKWIAIEKPIKVAVGSEAPRDFAIQFLVYFGASSDSSKPHKFATKNSDVFFYNGHSSIGYGPLDPRNFTAADFPASYQIMWVDGCVSYNYYEKDYLPLKQGGTQNLDLITNGIEAPAWKSGHAMGQFLVKLLDGKNASYRDLLRAAKDTEALRVVDGELDNDFKATTRIAITPR